jgi:hypothetical protein
MKILGITCEGRNSKYLGLPVYVGKKKRTFTYIKYRIWSKRQGWEGKKCYLRQERKF